ncbi:hypothetical protein AB1L88_15505 [Tautonia sp. JC769]|uniref:hypothetical protein n=1 Tax=Tautonia sp. JC769 TaxID=3232135 RepID=UPI00345A40C9
MCLTLQPPEAPEAIENLMPIRCVPPGWKGFLVTTTDGTPHRSECIYESRGSGWYGSPSGFDSGPWCDRDGTTAMLVTDAGQFGDPQVGDRVRMAKDGFETEITAIQPGTAWEPTRYRIAGPTQWTFWVTESLFHVIDR